VNIAHLLNIDWPAGDWGRISDSYSGGDSGPRSDELNFAKRDLNSRSEPEVGRREIRVADHGSVPCFAAVAGCLAAVAGCLAAVAGCLAAVAECLAALLGRSPGAEREQALISAEVCCWDQAAARDSKTLCSHREKARAGSHRILPSTSRALHLLFSGIISRNGLRQLR
jgi:hypothetical protein